MNGRTYKILFSSIIMATAIEASKVNKLNDYTVLGTVGEGAHGIVIKAQHKVTGTFVAFKKITLKKVTEEGIPVAMIREIKALQYIEKHENIVYMIDVFPQGLGFILVFEYLPSNLWEVMNGQRLTAPQMKCYLHMILNGLAFLHANHIMHRDLKPANLLIGDNGVLKIGDFGLCRLFFKGEKRAFSHQVATRWYRAPELLYGARFYNENVDIWAVGCVFAEMLLGEPLFAGENDIDQLYKVISSLGSPNERIWPGVTELPDYKKISFLPMKPVPLDILVKTDVPKAVEFLSKFLLYDSGKRTSAENAIINLEKQFVYWPNRSERGELAENMRVDFPNCIGFVDGTHVNLEEAPAIAGPEEYFSRKQKYGLHLQLICDFNHKIRHIKLGHTASAHDARVFASCDISKNPEKYFSKDQWIAGDAAYKSTPYLVTPFRKNAVTGTATDRRQFNYHFSKYRVKIEQVYGFMKEKFGSLKELRVRVASPEDHRFACHWVVACCVLYNIIRGGENVEDFQILEVDQGEEDTHSTDVSGEAKRTELFNVFLARP